MRSSLVFAILMLSSASHAAAANVDNGGDVFDTNCAECHSLKPGKVKKGPSLSGIFTRTAGTVAGFKYSNAMLNAKFPWNDSQLDAYITAPKTLVPGGIMKFDGLSSAQERADLIAFLHAEK